MNSMSTFRSFRKKISSRSFSFRKPPLSRTNTDQTLQIRSRSKSELNLSLKNTNIQKPTLRRTLSIDPTLQSRPRSKSERNPSLKIIRKPDLHSTLSIDQTLQSRSRSKSDRPPQTNPSSSPALKVKDLNIQVKESSQTAAKPPLKPPSRSSSFRRAFSMQKS